MDSDEILTGEGVWLSVQTASVLARAGAWLIDAIAAVIVFVALLYGVVLNVALVAPGALDAAAGIALVSTVLAVVFLGIPVTVETLTRGRSLGKLIFGLRVLRDDGGPVRLRHAAIRALIAVFELWSLMGSLAFVVSMLNDRGKRVGDFLAGTYVASMRGAKSQILPLAMPPELAPWIANADLRPLPDSLALQARQFLRRANQFPPPVRHLMGLRVAAHVERYVAPPPPPGTWPERFIAAVLYARRDRDQRAAWAAQPRLAAQLAGIDVLPYQIPDPEN